MGCEAAHDRGTARRPRRLERTINGARGAARGAGALVHAAGVLPARGMGTLLLRGRPRRPPCIGLIGMAVARRLVGLRIRPGIAARQHAARHRQKAHWRLRRTRGRIVRNHARQLLQRADLCLQEVLQQVHAPGGIGGQPVELRAPLGLQLHDLVGRCAHRRAHLRRGLRDDLLELRQRARNLHGDGREALAHTLHGTLQLMVRKHATHPQRRA